MSPTGIPDSGPTRRTTLKWLSLVAMSVGLSPGFASSAQGHQRRDAAAGYGRDPDLLAPPGQPWPLVLDERQRAAATAVLDVILPGDAAAPPASAVGLVDFLDEWVSAPYPQQQADAAQLIPLLEELDAAAMRRFNAVLSDLSTADRTALVAVHAEDASPRREAFRRLCVLAAAAYYTTPAGFTDIGFIGNVPRASFDGPPEEVLQRFAAALQQLTRG